MSFNFIKSFSVFTFFTFISRFFGLIREVINARVIGANELSDAFFVAFRLPNLFRSLFAEGAMNSAFIPVYNKISTESARTRFSTKILFLMSIFLIFFCILAEIFMPNVYFTLAPGIDSKIHIHQVGIELARIMFPFLFLISVTALIGCVLQSNNHFFPTSAYPIIMNVILIASAFIPHVSAVYSLSWSVLISGVVQMIFLFASAFYYKIPIITFTNLFSKEYGGFFDYTVKLFFKKLLPSILTTSITRIGITIDTIFASLVVGAVSYINYADRLYQLPLAIIGTAVSSVMLPVLSKKIAFNKSTNEVFDFQEKIFEFSFILMIPASIGLFFMSYKICAVLFGAKFGQDALTSTSYFLKIMSLSLPFNILNNIFNSIFFANFKTSKVTIFALYTLIVNVILNAFLFRFISFYSVAVATLISSIFNFTLLAFNSDTHWIVRFHIPLIQKISRIIKLNLFMILFLISWNLLSDHFFQSFSLYWYASVALEIIIMIILYFALVYKKLGYRLSYFK